MKEDGFDIYNLLRNFRGAEVIERINRINNLEIDKSVEIIPKGNDYHDVDIPNNSIVYCDIPYKDTNVYQGNFDYEAFYDWAESQEVPVYISEYQMPEDRFVSIWEKNVVSSLSATNKSCKKVEKLWIPKKQMSNKEKEEKKKW